MNTNEQHVREFAYQIWESEGCPVGHSDRHWAMARKLAASHDEHSHADTDVPASEPVEPISPGEPAHPVSPSEPIQPAEPRQPPTQSVAVTPPRKSRATVAADAPAKSLIDINPIAMGTPADASTKAAAKKPGKPKKSKATENESV